MTGSITEYEPDLLRQRLLSARYEKARCGKLAVSPPVTLVDFKKPGMPGFGMWISGSCAVPGGR